MSIEYALIRDINDQPWRADLLGTLLRQHLGTKRVHVNLIPLNPTPGIQWDASPRRVQDEFVARVRGGALPARCGTPGAGRSPLPAVSSPRRRPEP